MPNDLQHDEQAQLRASQLRAAERLARTANETTYPAPIRRSFIEDLDGSGPPPLAQMIGGRGGQGGGVRLKLYLSLLWHSRSEPRRGRPFESQVPQSTWAFLLGLPDPSGQGRERVARSLKWLEDHTLIRRERRPGLESSIILREDTGRDLPYSRPGLRYKELSDNPTERKYHDYFNLPAYFWFKQRVVDLDGRETAALLILLNELPLRGRTSLFSARFEEQWWSPSRWRDRFHLSDETRYRGFDGLVDKRVAEKHRGQVVSADFDARRRRRTYSLIDVNLDDRPITPKRERTYASLDGPTTLADLRGN